MKVVVWQGELGDTWVWFAGMFGSSSCRNDPFDPELGVAIAMLKARKATGLAVPDREDGPLPMVGRQFTIDMPDDAFATFVCFRDSYQRSIERRRPRVAFANFTHESAGQDKGEIVYRKAKGLVRSWKTQ